MKIQRGDLVTLTTEPWHQFAGESVLVEKVDDDRAGFDFVIPERRGHAPLKLIQRFIAHGFENMLSHNK